MYKKYYTIGEIQSMKFYELPNCIYDAILKEIAKIFHVLTKRMIEILNNAPVVEIDQYCDIYRYIKII